MVLDTIKHYPVLLKEIISIISPQHGGTFIDCTFGQGGYTKKILSFEVLSSTEWSKFKNKGFELLSSLHIFNSLTMIINITLAIIISLSKERRIIGFLIFSGYAVID